MWKTGDHLSAEVSPQAVGKGTGIGTRKRANLSTGNSRSCPHLDSSGDNLGVNIVEFPEPQSERTSLEERTLACSVKSLGYGQSTRLSNLQGDKEWIVLFGLNLNEHRSPTRKQELVVPPPPLQQWPLGPGRKDCLGVFYCKFKI